MKHVAAYLKEGYEKWYDKPYIHVKKQSTYESKTFGQVVSDVEQLAKALYQLGLKDQHIILYGENCYEWLLLDLAIMGYTGVAVPIDKEWTEFDVEHVKNVLSIGAVFYSNKTEETAKKIFLKDGIPCISMEMVNTLIEKQKNSNITLSEQTNMEQTVQILFTSGTTDTPKIIPLTQHNLFANWSTLYKRTPMEANDRSYLFLPLNHVYSGVANFLYSIISGMELYLCSDLKGIITELVEVKPTVVCMVPLILYRIYEARTETLMDCLRQIRFLYCGGSFTEPSIKQFFIKEGVNLIEAYGTTETASVIALERLGDENRLSNGVVFENLDVKIKNKDKEGYGEVLVKGESRTKGYLNDPNSDQFFDKEGYYHTGDIGKLDETRHLYLKGRAPRLIITANGKNVYADEIEQLILQQNDMKKVKVYEENGKIAAAIVSDRPEREVRTYVDEINKKLPHYKNIQILYVKEDCFGGRYK